jgi:hypothetical protein
MLLIASPAANLPLFDTIQRIGGIGAKTLSAESVPSSVSVSIVSHSHIVRLVIQSAFAPHAVAVAVAEHVGGVFGDGDVEFGVLGEGFEDGVGFLVDYLLEVVVVAVRGGDGGIGGEEYEEGEGG